MHDWPLLITRALTEVEVGGGHDDEGVAAAEFEDHLLDALRGGDADFDASAFTAGESGGGDAGVAQDGVDLFRADEESLECAGGEACTLQDFFDGESALGDVRGVLEEADVARHETGRDEAEDLPEREVPRHDAEDDTHRLVLDVAVFGVGGDVFVGQEALGVFGVVAAGPRAFYGFVDGGAESLTHLGGHEAGEEFFVAFEDVGSAVHHGRAGGEGEAAKGGEGGSGELEFGFDLGGGERFEGLEQLAGGGVDGCDSHGGERRNQSIGWALEASNRFECVAM
jgi:hypothetical protein